MKFERLDLQSPKPLYLQIGNIIQEGITSRKFSIGQKLPTEEELCKIFKVGRRTVREAMLQLVDEGYLFRRQKHGTFVASYKPNKKIDLKIKNEIALVICSGTYIDTVKNPYCAKILKGVEEKVKEKDIYLIYTTLNENELSLKNKGKDIAGLIVTGNITPEYFKIIKKSGIPFILIGDICQKTKSNEKVDVIGINDFESTYLVTKYLIGLGHRRIAYIVFSRGYFWEAEQLEGYRQAHKEAGIVCDRDLLIETAGPDYDSGYIAMKEFLRKSIHSASAQDGERKVEPISFTALFCTWPDMDMGAVKALEEQGLKIPEDISVVSEGSNQFTTLTGSVEELGKAAVERLIERITNPDLKPEKIIIPQELIIRNSARKLKN